MSRRIQSYPEGLTEVLQLKGQESLQFGPDFVGTVDTLQLFFAQRSQVAVDSEFFQNTTNQVQVRVPAGRIWLVGAVSYYQQARNAGSRLQGSLTFQPNGQTTGIQLGLTQPSTMAGPVNGGETQLFDEQRTGVCWQPSRPWVFRAGDEFRGRPTLAQAISENPIHNLTVWYAEFGGE